jgi:hypothetical protein
MLPNLLTFVLDRLRDPATNLAAVVSDTGLKRSWLWQLKDGRIPDPSVRKIQLLADYFSSKEAQSPKLSPRPASGPGAMSESAPAGTASGASQSDASCPAAVPTTATECRCGAA